MSTENNEKYNKAFKDSFDLSDNDLGETLVYSKVDGWDSIGHMALVDELEKVFGITFEADDIVDFSSYFKGKEIMSKYGVALT